MSGDTSLPEPIYADDYVLVRPNGDTLEKREILDDLRRHSMRFTSFEVNDVLIRIRGMVGILTADVGSMAMRVGVEVKTHARQLAIVSKEKSKMSSQQAGFCPSFRYLRYTRDFGPAAGACGVSISI